jgi:hypothetical protein
MRRLVLHVGSHKTGTSAIQRWLNDNRDRLRLQGWLYPAAGQWPDHSHHAWPLALSDSIPNAGQRAQFSELVEAAESELLMTRAGNVVLSSELFEKYPLKGVDLSLLEDFAKRIDAKVEIVVFFRRQDLLIESVFKQWVKDSDRRLSIAPVTFANNYRNRLNYAEIARVWRDLNWVDRVSVVTNALARDPILDFVGAIDGFPAADSTWVEPATANISLDGLALEFKHFFNKIPDIAPLDANLLRAITYTSFPDERLSLFDSAQRTAEIEMAGKWNDALVAEFGVARFDGAIPRFDRLFEPLSGRGLLTGMEKIKEHDERLAWRLAAFMMKAIVQNA